MKNAISKIAVFAIVLFCSQVAFGQTAKVVCYDDNSWYEYVWIDAPYFSADLGAEAYEPGAYAEASVSWNCITYSRGASGGGGFENIGRHDAGGVDVSVACSTTGYGSWAVAEAWAEW